MSHTVAPSSPDERLNHIERQLAKHRTQLARRSRMTAFVALALLVLLAGYFYFGYKSFDEVTRPEMVVQVANTFVSTNLPELRKNLQAEIIRSAPGWADQFSRELQAGMPQARQKLEDYIVAQMDTVLHETNVLSQEQFRDFLKQNRPVLEQGFRDLAAGPNMAEQTMNQVIDALDVELSKQMQLESSELFEIVAMMKEKLDVLQKGQGLTDEQQLERRFLMIARRFWLESPILSSGAATGTANPGVAAASETATDAAAPPAETTSEPPPADDTKEKSEAGENDSKSEP